MSERPRQITAEAIIDQVVTEHPATVEVFLRWRMHCVGCPISLFESIADACRNYRRPEAPFLAELQAAAATGARLGGR